MLQTVTRVLTHAVNGYSGEGNTAATQVFIQRTASWLTSEGPPVRGVTLGVRYCVLRQLVAVGALVLVVGAGPTGLDRDLVWRRRLVPRLGQDARS